MALLHFSLLLLLCYLGVDAATFTLQNRCNRTIWPGIQADEGHPLPMSGGLELQPQQSIDITPPLGWSGHFWARDGCTFDASGQGTCVTGDCGRGLQCNGASGAPPVSAAEFILDAPFGLYFLNLAEGYNMPISIIPSSSDYNCSSVMCNSDLNLDCPDSLQVKGSDGRVVACKTACMAFNRPEYCCTRISTKPCKPTEYSEIFKRACPNAFNIPYIEDDTRALFTCPGANFLITFC